MAEFKVLDNGDYQLSDGRIIPANEVGKMYEKEEDTKEKEKDTLEEGQCSGCIRLED